MLQPEFFNKLRWNLFRMHYQFIMANDMRAPYEYMMLVCGPVPVEQWARDGREMLDALRRRRDVSANLRSCRAKMRNSHSTTPRGSSRGSSAAALLAEPGTTTRRPRIKPS